MSNADTEQAIAEAIQRRAGELLEDLRLHVETPTGGGHMRGIERTRGLLTERLVALGATHTREPGRPKPDWLPGGDPDAEIPDTSVCERLRGARSGRVLIAGHMDTVHDPQGPFRTLSIADDGRTAIGPGCVDMKGGLVIAVAALEALEECGVGAAWSFTLNADEETGTFHSEHTLREQAGRHDFGIALEPALPAGELVVERMGAGQFMIETRGRSAHVGRDFASGVSAVTEMGRSLVAVGEMPDPGRGMILSIGPLEGGVATNAVPDRARAWGNVRFSDNDRADEIGAMLDALQTPEDAMPGVIVRRVFNRPAKPRTPGTESLALAARSAAESLGQSLPFASTGGVCDGNILQDAGLPTIDTLGVRGGGLHTPQEWIDLSSLVERCQMLAILIARLSAGGSEIRT